MGKCIKCNNYCKDHHKYCLNCYSQIIECDICFKSIDEIKDYADYDGIICEECYFKIQTVDHRKNYSAEYRAKDGHYVRSKSEMVIDNYLYDKKIVHAYEKKIYDIDDPEIEYLSDFYLPDYDLYIEYWGLENNKQYKEKMLKKQKLYEQNDMKLLNIYEENIKNLEDYLEKQLLIIKKG